MDHQLKCRKAIFFYQWSDYLDYKAVPRPLQLRLHDIGVGVMFNEYDDNEVEVNSMVREESVT